MASSFISKLLLFVFTCLVLMESVAAFGFPMQPYPAFMGPYSIPQNLYGGYGYPMNYYQPPAPQYYTLNYNDPLRIANAPYSPITILQSQTNTAKLNISQRDPINVQVPPPVRVHHKTRRPCVPLPHPQCTGYFKYHPACQDICDPDDD